MGATDERSIIRLTRYDLGTTKPSGNDFTMSQNIPQPALTQDDIRVAAWAEIRELLERQLAPLGQPALSALAPRRGGIASSSRTSQGGSARRRASKEGGNKRSAIDQRQPSLVAAAVHLNKSINERAALKTKIKILRNLASISIHWKR
jgi:hypothetical protein